MALAYLFRRWRALARSLRTSPAIAGVPQAASGPRSPDEIAQQEKEEWPPQPAGQPAAATALSGADSENYFYETEDDLRQEPSAFGAPPRTPPPVQPTQAERPSYVPPAPEPVRRPPTAAVVVAAGSKPIGSQVSDFMAAFHMGEPDYDEAFDINDPTDGYMGQCGLQLSEQSGRDRDQAVALQAWLWDSSDPDTQTKVLMGEGAYRDTALRSQYAGQHEVIPVRAPAPSSNCKAMIYCCVAGWRRQSSPIRSRPAASSRSCRCGCKYTGEHDLGGGGLEAGYWKAVPLGPSFQLQARASGSNSRLYSRIA